MAADDDDEKFKQVQDELREACEQKLNATPLPGNERILIFIEQPKTHSLHKFYYQLFFTRITLSTRLHISSK